MPGITSPRRLFLLRHAQPAQPRPGEADHDRPIAPGAAQVLPDVAAEIDRHLERPLDLVLASTATRVRETLDGVLPHLSKPHEVRRLQRLYLAGAERAVAELHELPVDVRTVLLCGHNPGLHELALAIVRGDEPEIREFPPAALVVIDLDAEWADVGAGAGSGRLVSFSAPPRE